VVCAWVPGRGGGGVGDVCERVADQRDGQRARGNLLGDLEASYRLKGTLCLRCAGAGVGPDRKGGEVVTRVGGEDPAFARRRCVLSSFDRHDSFTVARTI